MRNVNSGLVSTSRNSEREEKFKWIGPLISGRNKFYRLKSRPDIQATSLKELQKYTIGAPLNDVYEKIFIKRGFKKGYNLLETRNKHETAKLFFNGKLDLLVLSPMTLYYQLDQYGFNAELVEPIFPLHLENLQGNYLALNKKVPDDIAHKLQQALDELRRNGLLQQFIDKYKWTN